MDEVTTYQIADDYDLEDYGLRAARYVFNVELRNFVGPVTDGFKQMIDDIEENEPIAAGMMVGNSNSDATKMGITLFIIDDPITVKGNPALFFRSILLNGMEAGEYYQSIIPVIIEEGLFNKVENFIIDTGDTNFLSNFGFKVPKPGDVDLSYYHNPNYPNLNYMVKSVIRRGE